MTGKPVRMLVCLCFASRAETVFQFGVALVINQPPLEMIVEGDTATAVPAANPGRCHGPTLYGVIHHRRMICEPKFKTTEAAAGLPKAATFTAKIVSSLKTS